jgi:hypothetical protein
LFRRRAVDLQGRPTTDVERVKAILDGADLRAVSTVRGSPREKPVISDLDRARRRPRCGAGINAACVDREAALTVQSPQLTSPGRKSLQYGEPPRKRPAQKLYKEANSHDRPCTAHRPRRAPAHRDPRRAPNEETSNGSLPAQSARRIAAGSSRVARLTLIYVDLIDRCGAAAEMYVAASADPISTRGGSSERRWIPPSDAANI